MPEGPPGPESAAGFAAPVVSVTIPCYRVAGYIAECLQSVFAQTYREFEVIVVNDGSPDTEEFERVIAPWRERIVYIRQENRGVAGARNTAVRAARGRYVAVLDPDDKWEPEYLATQVGILEGDASIDILYGDAKLFGDIRGPVRTSMQRTPQTGEPSFERLVRQECVIIAPATVARREVLLRAGLYDESLRNAEDYDLWLRAVKQGARVAYHRKALACYRIRSDSLTADPVPAWRHLLRALEKTRDTLPLTPAERRAVEERIAFGRAHLDLATAKSAFLVGDPGKAAAHLKAANGYFRSAKLRASAWLLRLAPGLLLGLYRLRERYLAWKYS